MSETIDLGAVRWTVEEQDGFLFVLGLEYQPDGYEQAIYELRVSHAEDENGVDRTAAVAEAVARKLAQS